MKLRWKKIGDVVRNVKVKKRSPQKVPLAEEDPQLKAARLRRRRKLLFGGALPALVALVAVIWTSAVLAWTFMGHNAIKNHNYATAVSDFRTVKTLDPWLQRWRVLYNLGTAQTLNEDFGAAVTELEAALALEPDAKKNEDGLYPADSPTCLIRKNLAQAYTGLAGETKDAATAKSHQERAVELTKVCASRSGAASSATSTSNSSANSTADPSQNPTGGSTPTPNPTASATADSGDEEPSASPSPQEADPKAEDLKKRNQQADEDGSSGNGYWGKGW